MKIVLSGLLVFLIIGSAAGQTIHIDDLDYFVGCFARTDTTDYESVDLSKFIEWKIIKPDPVYKQRKLRDLKYRKDRFWVYYWYPLSAQKGEIKGPMYVNGFDRYRFYLLSGYFPYKYTIGILTIWEIVTQDSIRYIKGQMGEFNTDREGYGSVELVSIFPDTSILLAVRFVSEYTGTHRFLVGDIDHDFRSFYESKKYRTRIPLKENGIIVSYDFNESKAQSYQTIELIKYFTGVSPIENYYSDFGIPRIDSVDTRILDLWEMVQEFRGSE